MFYEGGKFMIESPRIDRVVLVSHCRAFLELKDRAPLTSEEWGRFRNLIVDCGLKGIPFDDVSYLYPLQIPSKPRVQVLQDVPRVVSISTLYDRTGFVGVIGDKELEDHYLAHPSAFIYAVGKLEKCKKNEKEYTNLRPRGWLVVQIEPAKDSSLSIAKCNEGENSEKKKKR
jgi:hypothetical protein